VKSFYVAPSLLGRLYMRPREYMSELKSLVKATGYTKVPVELRDLVKEQAWEKVYQQEITTQGWVIR
jgi:hypothetical protein